MKGYKNYSCWTIVEIARHKLNVKEFAAEKDQCYEYQYKVMEFASH